jgi:hypothetical protein
MLSLIIFLALIVFAVVAPILALRKYYIHRHHTKVQKVLFIAVAIITWPLAPVVLVIRHRDYLLLSMFAVSFSVVIVAFGYFISQNADAVMTLSQLIIT